MAQGFLGLGLKGPTPILASQSRTPLKVRAKGRFWLEVVWKDRIGKLQQGPEPSLSLGPPDNLWDLRVIVQQLVLVFCTFHLCCQLSPWLAPSHHFGVSLDATPSVRTHLSHPCPLGTHCSSP
jgi:hypothetical protein